MVAGQVVVKVLHLLLVVQLNFYLKFTVFFYGTLTAYKVKAAALLEAWI